MFHRELLQFKVEIVLRGGNPKDIDDLSGGDLFIGDFLLSGEQLVDVLLTGSPGREELVDFGDAFTRDIFQGYVDELSIDQLGSSLSEVFLRKELQNRIHIEIENWDLLFVAHTEFHKDIKG